LNVTPEYALYEISYQNAIMYARAVPMPNDKSESDRPVYDESLDACNPANFEDFDNEEIVRA
jgi:hypothetical protein